MASDPPVETYVLAYDKAMKTITASKARANLYRLIEECAEEIDWS